MRATATFPYCLIDVFTDAPLAGNPLAVVHDADGLDDATMLALARETRLSETAFVQRASAGGASYRNLIWTVSGEIPFAGHPSLGVAVAVALRRGEHAARYVQQTRAGLQEVTVERRGGRARASVLQEPARFGDEVAAGPLAAALGLGERDGHRELRPQRVSTGLPTIVVPLGGAGAQPDWSALERLGPVNVYAFALDGSTARVRARCFPSPQGEGEDAATGSAAGALMAYLHRWTGRNRLDIRQGEEMGRPSRLTARVERHRVRVSGDAVVLVTGEIRLPAPRRRQ